jgi:hypothetical protein
VREHPMVNASPSSGSDGGALCSATKRRYFAGGPRPWPVTFLFFPFSNQGFCSVGI